MRLSKGFVVFVSFFALVNFCQGDTPANCTYEDVNGLWNLFESATQDNCSNAGPVTNQLQVDLQFPNVAFDHNGNKGYWTIIYNQGFEVVINYRKYFAFSKYIQEGSNVTSYCGETLPGWSHDVLGHNWACYSATKVLNVTPKVHQQITPVLANRVHKVDKDFVRRINLAQNTWKAKVYPEYHNVPLEDMIRKRGGLKSRIHNLPSPAPVTKELLRLTSTLPEEWDWRNVRGANYVSPVRNQGSCGSCYSFSSVGMIEARLRVATNNSNQVIISPQDIVSCSKYSQGCDGGFPYLIAGKYAQDFGMVPEQCNPYKGQDTQCQTDKQCHRYYVAEFGYVGGFYGGCNEELMKLHLVQQGPMSVSFEVYDDFMQYSGGVYHHTGISDSTNLGFNPFEITNHAVLLVGYGVDKKSGEKYWLVKNSWGTSWGENGYFRIRRGTDECSIESIAVEASPIP